MNNNFKAKIETINGRKVLKIDAIGEEIKRPDGGTDVIIKVPTLKIIKDFGKDNIGG